MGLALSLMLAGSGLMTVLRQPIGETLRSPFVYASLGIAYLWIALAVMTWGWLRNRPVHWHWPLLGTLIGLFCLTVFAMLMPAVLLLIAPCAVLGLYLDYFHATTAAPPAHPPV